MTNYHLRREKLLVMRITINMLLYTHDPIGGYHQLLYEMEYLVLNNLVDYF